MRLTEARSRSLALVNSPRTRTRASCNSKDLAERPEKKMNMQACRPNPDLAVLPKRCSWDLKNLGTEMLLA